MNYQAASDPRAGRSFSSGSSRFPCKSSGCEGRSVAAPSLTGGVDDLSASSDAPDPAPLAEGRRGLVGPPRAAGIRARCSTTPRAQRAIACPSGRSPSSSERVRRRSARRGRRELVAVGCDGALLHWSTRLQSVVASNSPGAPHARSAQRAHTGELERRVLPSLEAYRSLRRASVRAHREREVAIAGPHWHLGAEPANGVRVGAVAAHVAWFETERDVPHAARRPRRSVSCRCRSS